MFVFGDNSFSCVRLATRYQKVFLLKHCLLMSSCTWKLEAYKFSDLHVWDAPRGQCCHISFFFPARHSKLRSMVMVKIDSWGYVVEQRSPQMEFRISSFTRYPKILHLQVNNTLFTPTTAKQNKTKQRSSEKNLRMLLNQDNLKLPLSCEMCKQTNSERFPCFDEEGSKSVVLKLLALKFIVQFWCVFRRQPRRIGDWGGGKKLLKGILILKRKQQRESHQRIRSEINQRDKRLWGSDLNETKLQHLRSPHLSH